MRPSGARVEMVLYAVGSAHVQDSLDCACPCRFARPPVPPRIVTYNVIDGKLTVPEKLRFIVPETPVKVPENDPVPCRVPWPVDGSMTTTSSPLRAPMKSPAKVTVR